jgi:uncharacterized membrane protein SirB2
MNIVKAKLFVVRKHWTQMGEEQERKRIIKVLNGMVDVYLLEKLLVEASVIVNAIEFIKAESQKG